MDRRDKEQLVASLNEMFRQMTLVVVTHQSGMTVAEMNELRGRMRDAGAKFRVTKNRITRLAVEGTSFQGLQPLFTGPTAIAVSVDPVAAAKVCVADAKANQKLTVVGGALGEKLLEPEAVAALATLPSLDELRAKLVGLIQAPATKLAGVTQAPAGQLARVFGAYGATGEAG